MNIYLVGGAVRDKLMGYAPNDLDYVVTDVSAEEMIEQGFQRVGNSFSVFLHPETKAEYALPRGQNLTEDLFCRDLTINAMAMDSSGKLIDPFHGSKDLQNKVLRHVSDAFTEDPLRVLRLFRFKTLYPDFTIAPETIELTKTVVKSESYKSLDAERVFKELRTVLNAKKPSIFFDGLKASEGLDPFFTELKQLIDVPQNPLYHPEGDCWNHTMLVLDAAAKLTNNILVRYAALVHDLGKGITPKEILPKHIGHESTGIKLVQDFSKKIKVPNDWIEAAIIVTKFHLKVHRLQEMKPSTIVRMFYEMDAFRKPQLVDILALACQADELGKMKAATKAESDLIKCFEAIKEVSIKDVSPDLKGRDIKEAIMAKRVKIVAGLDLFHS
jgi:tRNA nucleotidyltransferase (CCA-adding enzyme)